MDIIEILIMKLVEQILKFIKDLDWTTISETIIASVILSAGVVIWKIIKKYRKVEPWKENERISKLSGFSDDNYLTVVNSSLYIPISGQKEAPNNNIELVASENRFILEDMLLKKFFSTRKSIEKKSIFALAYDSKTTIFRAFHVGRTLHAIQYCIS